MPRKGIKPKNWNSLHTPEMNQKRSLSMKGKRNSLGVIRSEEFKKKISNVTKGKKNPFYGKKHTEESNRKNREAHKGKIGYWRERKRPELSKENNPNWHGGISYEPYSVDWTEDLKMAIRRRDRYTCICGKEPATIVHHIDYDKKNCDPKNLITLCEKCHCKTNYNRKYWIKYFQSRHAFSHFCVNKMQSNGRQSQI